MRAKQPDTKKQSKQHERKQPSTALVTGRSESQKDRIRETDNAVRQADEAVQKEQVAGKSPDRTAGQNHAVDQKRNDEQQYHAAGVAHDPHNRTQGRVDSGDPEAGDVDEETRSEDAPYNKTYGHHS